MATPEGRDLGGSADRVPEGVELAVLLGLERYCGQLATIGVDYRGGDGLVDQVAVGEQSAVGRGVGRDEVEELAGTPVQDQRGAAVILPASDVAAVEHAGLADLCKYSSPASRVRSRR